MPMSDCSDHSQCVVVTRSTSPSTWTLFFNVTNCTMCPSATFLPCCPQTQSIVLRIAFMVLYNQSTWYLFSCGSHWNSHRLPSTHTVYVFFLSDFYCRKIYRNPQPCSFQSLIIWFLSSFCVVSSILQCLFGSACLSGLHNICFGFNDGISQVHMLKAKPLQHNGFSSGLAGR